MITEHQEKINLAIKEGERCCAEYAGYNHNYKKRGYMCPYEYCIETQPLYETCDDSKSCPIFDNDCPGGVEQVEICKLKLNPYI